MSEYSGYYNARDYWLDITPQRFLHEITPGNMKFSVKNAKDDSVMVLVDCDSFMFKLKNPKSQEGLVTQKPQVLKKGEVVEVELEFRNPDEDKKHLPGVYSPENAEGKMTISHSDIGSFIYVRNIEVHEDEIGEPYDIENAPPNHLIAVCGVKRRITMLNMKEDTEESRKIKDVFGPIMLNKMRAESDGPSLDRKVLKKKNAKSKKKKKCCTIL
ncbi:hypothetical protein L3Y34_019855 [Caenorhabditis briggsae]|uniref:Uncharacterized protein n=1 Tax=Caenorhabditis briggsae TaxID=6238 RepID=A0AAE9DQ31_CAEBR|nr:hypothetical protein L3Y34_019855 [Caenorhabditis briggsae]